MHLKPFFLSVLLLPALAQAEWAQFRGPSGQGEVPDSQQLPTEWTTTKNVTWSTKVPGKGWSSPVILDGKVFLTAAVAEGEDQDAHGVDRSLRTMCLDGKSGEVIWDTEVFKQDGAASMKIHSKNSHASPTPIIQYDRIFVHFGHEGTACLDLSGKIVWSTKSQAYGAVHGNGATPLIVKDKLIFSCDGRADPFVVALNVRNGEVAWKTPRNTHAKSPFSFSTPLLIEAGGREELILPGSGFIWAYNPANGSELWKVNWDEGYSVVPRPVAANGLIFASSGFNKAILYAVKPGGSGDVTESNVVWKGDKGVPKNASFTVVGDELYTFDDAGVGTCWDTKTGDVHWQERVAGPFSSSPIHNNGRIYAMDEQGVTKVLAAGKEYKELASNDLEEKAYASFAAAGNTLFIRTETKLYRIEE